MKVGIISDTHLGVKNVEKNEIIDKTEEILEYFASKDVDTVVHLGDMVHERNEIKDKKNIQDMSELFDSFNFFNTKLFTFGNHDRNSVVLMDDFNSNSPENLKYKYFEQYGWISEPQVINKNNKNSVILVDSSSCSGNKYVGKITDESIDLIREQLRNGCSVTILTHYPLDTISIKHKAFELFPEQQYPVNRLDVFYPNNSLDGNIDSIYCGHLHPKKTSDETGSVLSSHNTVVEPVVKFIIKENKPIPKINKNINYESLIFKI